MKKSVLAAAILCVAGSAQAYTVVHDTVGASHVDLGATNIGGFHGPIGAPGIAVSGSGSFISLQSIAGFTYVTTKTVNSSDFSYHQLPPGFIHTNPAPGETALGIGLDGLKVLGIPKEVYFGIASTTTGTSGVYSHQAWYVGDKDTYSAPAASTVYDAIALVSTSSDAVNAPQFLEGTLTVNGSLQLAGVLTDGTATLDLKASSAGDNFSGNAEYYVGATAPGNNGTYSGQYFGDASSGEGALAGVASGTYGGDSYVAAFGGKQQ